MRVSHFAKLKANIYNHSPYAISFYFHIVAYGVKLPNFMATHRAVPLTHHLIGKIAGCDKGKFTLGCDKTKRDKSTPFSLALLQDLEQRHK
jgi:hypothetical protein